MSRAGVCYPPQTAAHCQPQQNLSRLASQSKSGVSTATCSGDAAAATRPHMCTRVCTCVCTRVHVLHQLACSLMIALHEPPSPGQDEPTGHLAPAVLLVLQHWVAAVMHLSPHTTLPEGQAVQGGGKCSQQSYALSQGPVAATGHLASTAHCCYTTQHAFSQQAELPSSPHDPPSEGQAKGVLHVRPAVELLLQHWVAGLMHRLPHLAWPEGQLAETARQGGRICSWNACNSNKATLSGSVHEQGNRLW